jgi:hypothetical protein
LRPKRRGARVKPLQPIVDGGAVDQAQREEGPSLVAQEGELREGELGGWKRRPLRRAPPVRVKCEAAHPHGARPRREILRLERRPPAGDLGRGASEVGEAVGAPRRQIEGRAERGEGEAATLGLLPGEPAILGEPRREDGGGRIVDVDLERDARESPARRLGEQRCQPLDGGVER